MSLPITTEEKINYIYNHIKTEKRNRIFKIFFKITIIFTIFYWSQYIINNVWQEKIQTIVTKQISDITVPIIKDLVKDLEKSSVDWINSDMLMDTIRNNPELLNKIKNNDY